MMSSSPEDVGLPVVPLVSVLMPAYNAEETIGAAISSVLTSDYPRLEVVVVDDGSCDATLRIARAHQDVQRPGRAVRVFSGENRGVGAARNTAMSEAVGEYLALCDADDLLLPPHLSTAVRLLMNREASGQPRTLVACNAYLLTPAGIHPSRQFAKEPLPRPEEQRSAMLENNIGSNFAVFSRRLLNEVGVFDENLRYCEDWDLWARAVYAGWTIVRQPEPYALYRWTGQSASSSRAQMYAGESEVIRRLLTSGGLDAGEYAKALRRLKAGSPIRLASEAEQALRDGDLTRARKLFSAASALVPHQRRVRAKAAIAHLPGGARWLRRRQSVIDARIGYGDEMRR